MGSVNVLSHIMDSLRSLNKSSNLDSSLKQGQIVTGKVVKLFPNQQAQIQVGNQQLNAQLEAPLNLNSRYWFQVTSTENIVNLKVLSEIQMKQNIPNMTSFFNQFDLALTKDRKAFVNELMKQNLPFQKGDLKQALKLVDQFGGEKEVKQVLFTMLKRNLPIQSAVFQGLYERTKNLPPITSTLNDLNKQLNLPSNMKIQPQSLSKALVAELNASSTVEKPAIFTMLQKATLIPRQQDAMQWRSDLSKWDATQQANLNFKEGEVASFKGAPFSNTNVSEIAKKLADTFNNQLPLTKQEVQVLRKWNDHVERLVKNVEQSGKIDANLQTSFVKLNKSLIQQGTLTKMLPFLQQNDSNNSNYRNLITTMANVDNNGLKLNNSLIEPLQQLQKNVSTLLNQQLTPKETRAMLPLLASLQREYPTMLRNDAQQFLVQIKNSIRMTGVNYEHQLLQQIDQEVMNRPEASVKSAVIQMLQESPSAAVTEKLQSILHQLNGMVLSSHETDKTINLNLQLPGDWFGIQQDLVMDLEGRKSETGDIDPEFCNILFYLHLESLKETVIDMRVQKRVVHLTLYTENVDTAKHVDSYKELLEEGLNKLDYKLSSVRHKAITSDFKREQTYNPDVNSDTQGGFDFKI